MLIEALCAHGQDVFVNYSKGGANLSRSMCLGMDEYGVWKMATREQTSCDAAPRRSMSRR